MAKTLGLVVGGAVVLVVIALGCGQAPELLDTEHVGESSEALEADSADYVSTPGGRYHKSCVYEVGDSAEISHLGAGSRVRRRDGTTFDIPACAHRSYPTRAKAAAPPGVNAPVDNGWMEYADTYLPSPSWWKQMSASWTVPAKPTASYPANAVYYTFPGIQSGYIIQPVLQYNWAESTLVNWYGKWSLASWHCNSGSNCIHSNVIAASAGQAITGTITSTNCNATGNCKWTITTKNVTAGTQTVLTIADTQVYQDGVGGAVEVYNLTSCAQFPATGVSYTNISLLDQNNAPVTPEWGQGYGGFSPSCGFKVATTPTTVTLYHNCTPKTCQASQCGQTIANGCGSTITCPACPPPPPACGDGICNGTEDCCKCPQDCAGTACFTCFVAGTPITMADGTTRAIETIKKGDEVMAFDVEAGHAVPSHVTETFEHFNGVDGTVLVDGKLRTTPNHPFYANGKWVRADELRPGDSLIRLGSTTSLAGEATPLATVESLPGGQKVYNLEVDTQHDYFAGGVLVHNKNACTAYEPAVQCCGAGQTCGANGQCSGKGGGPL